MRRVDLSPLQSYELCNICDCGEFEYSITEAKFAAILEMADAGLLIVHSVEGNSNWRLFKPTSQGRQIAASIETRQR